MGTQCAQQFEGRTEARDIGYSVDVDRGVCGGCRKEGTIWTEFCAGYTAGVCVGKSKEENEGEFCFPTRERRRPGATRRIGRAS